MEEKLLGFDKKSNNSEHQHLANPIQLLADVMFGWSFWQIFTLAQQFDQHSRNLPTSILCTSLRL